ncbi:MAG: hypothetical protein PHW46_01235 [Candidatus Omnitrophica bacterium]|nr:hypothetical protein [Candidatus Omnitrophota bacterium]
MGVIEAIKKGFVLSGKLMNVVLVFFVFNAIVGLISLPMANPANTGKPGAIAISIVSSVIFFLIFIFLQGGALGLVRDQIKSSTSSMANFAGYGKKYYLRILGLLFFYILLAIAVVLLLSLASAGILLLGDNVVTRSLVATIVTIVAIILITLLLYPIYAIIVDDTGVVASFKKGVGLAISNFWKTLGLFITMLLLSLVISLLIGFLAGLATVPIPVNIGQIVIAIVNALVQSYIPIVMMVGFMCFYMSLEQKVS